MDWIEQANKMNQEWLATQQKMLKDFMQSGNDAVSAATDRARTSTSGYADTGKKMARQYMDFWTPVKAKTVDDYVSDANKAFFDNYSEAFSKSKDLWKQAWPGMANAEPEPDTLEQTAYQGAFEEMFSPNAWWGKMFSEEHVGAKMSDLAMFAGVTNYDKKMAVAVDEWQQLQSEIANYAYVVMSAWLEANNRFQGELEDAIKTEQGTKGWQELMQYWQQTADKTLMEMHKSEDFLKAQKRLIEASTAYRMAEQTIAEETGKALHLPTRTEVDELHKKVYDLSRQVREMKKELRKFKEDAAAVETKPKTAARKKAPAKKAPVKKTQPKSES